MDSENYLWAVPSSVDEFNKWAEKIHFQIGDSLVLKYDSKTDSVLEVTEEDYKICNNANQIKSHHGGETTISLEKSAQAPSPYHHRHRYHAPAPALTNSATGLKAAVGLRLCRDQDASRTWETHHVHKLPRNAWKSAASLPGKEASWT
ncbi:early nodulin 1 [Olea europaea subsp. europaea]|uniref:Early nodulin 1 n=1 Tax=Olea europaea subsp. europaea TaxID=158383 RepID=A0A8S0T8F7_OLEEU|nr:early nodulin 1 [Olea europaea subsp. europaea]